MLLAHNIALGNRIKDDIALEQLQKYMCESLNKDIEFISTMIEYLSNYISQ